MRPDGNTTFVGQPPLPDRESLFLFLGCFHLEFQDLSTRGLYSSLPACRPSTTWFGTSRAAWAPKIPTL